MICVLSQCLAGPCHAEEVGHGVGVNNVPPMNNVYVLSWEEYLPANVGLDKHWSFLYAVCLPVHICYIVYCSLLKEYSNF